MMAISGLYSQGAINLVKDSFGVQSTVGTQGGMS